MIITNNILDADNKQFDGILNFEKSWQDRPITNLTLSFSNRTPTIHISNSGTVSAPNDELNSLLIYIINDSYIYIYIYIAITP